MGGYGICPSCSRYKYLNSRICKTCSYDEDNCIKCDKLSKIYVDGLCYLCYQERQVSSQLVTIERDFTPLNEYNDHLFSLYLQYIRRYRLQYIHLPQARRLALVLGRDQIPAIRSWIDIYQLRDQYQIYQKVKRKHGSAFGKIGQMLLELGVLAPKEEDISAQIDHTLNQLNTQIVKDFIVALDRLNTAPITIIHYLRSLISLEEFAVNKYNIESLLHLNQIHISTFFQSDILLSLELTGRRRLYCEVKRFYRWLVYQGAIPLDPCLEIDLSRRSGRVVICSENQYQQLRSYICNPQSSSEGAMLLALILYFGLSTMDLAHAQISIQNNCLQLKLRRKQLTKGKRYYRRKELLVLPSKPRWFLQLQKRFFVHWGTHYQEVKKTFPNTPLILPYNNISNRYLTTDAVRERLDKFTCQATGQSIPIRILRQTCGHLYASKSDASILSSMGWSEQFAFHYTWLPRLYFLDSSETEQGNHGEEPCKG